MTILLTVRKKDGTQIDDALELFSLPPHLGKPTKLNPDDTLRMYFVHYKHKRKAECVHFLVNNTRIKGRAYVKNGVFTGKDILTLVSVTDTERNQATTSNRSSTSG